MRKAYIYSFCFSIWHEGAKPESSVTALCHMPRCRGKCRRSVPMRSAAPASRPTQRQAGDQWWFYESWATQQFPMAGLIAGNSSAVQNRALPIISCSLPSAAGRTEESATLVVSVLSPPRRAVQNGPIGAVASRSNWYWAATTSSNFNWRKTPRSSPPCLIGPIFTKAISMTASDISWMGK